MAGDWLKVEANTPEKAEVLAITVRMGWDDADLTVGKLFRLWRWFDQHTVDGNAATVTTALLDRIVGVSGFCEAVRDSGWLTITDDGISLPGFDKHNGNTAKSRSMTAKRVAKHKASSGDNAKTNASTVSDALAREEKIIEEDQKPCDQQADSPDRVPFEKIRAVYNRACTPVLPEALKLDDKRKRNIRKCYHMEIDGAHPFHSGEFWEQYFSECLLDNHWIGNNDRGWRADIEFLTRESTVLKVLERS